MGLYYVGLDVHLKTSTAKILDGGGQAVATKTVRGHWSKMADWLERQKLPMAICFEASCGYGVLHERLARFAKRVTVAHPSDLRLIFRSKRKNDRVDAHKLAMLLLLDQVPAVHVPSVDVRSWRELIEFRGKQIQQRVKVKNQIRAMLRSHGVPAPHDFGLWTKQGLAWLAELTWPTGVTSFRCELLLDQLRDAESAVKKVTRRLDRIADDHSGVTLLKTICGIGPRTAEAVMAYIDDPHRFARISRIGAYFGLIPCQDSSAGVNRLGHITKQGPATVRKLLVEAAWRCIKLCPQMRAFFDRVTGGKPDRRKIAVIAVAHKLARIMLAMLKTGEVWDPMRHASEAFDAIDAPNAADATDVTGNADADVAGAHKADANVAVDADANVADTNVAVATTQPRASAVTPASPRSSASAHRAAAPPKKKPATRRRRSSPPPRGRRRL